ncbi:MAG TPA: DUF1559 domain-containing protein, partial [Fimbriiglobus sp.]|nr:DUF1559 domain-containing protein [Fimbriiglobus sp.]
NAEAFYGSPSTSRITDGLSNTIAMAERYAIHCGENNVQIRFPTASPSFSRAVFADGGPNSRLSSLLPPHYLPTDYPITSGNPPVTHGNRGRKFQADHTLQECDPRVANTPHRSGMLVLLTDGSVQTLSPRIAETTYWALVTPAAGDIPGDF